MPVKLAWNAPEQTSLIVICTGAWTAQEILDVSPEADEMIASVSHPVDLIINLQGAKNYLPQNSMSHAGELWRQRNKQVRSMIIVGASALLKMIYDLFLHIYMQNKTGLFLVNTLEEAFDIVATHQPPQPPITE